MRSKPNFIRSCHAFLTRKPLSMNGRESSDASELVWSDLTVGLNDVFNRNPMTPKRYMELYSHVFNFCTAQSSQANQSPAGRGGGMAPRSRRSGATAANAASTTTTNMATDFMGIELYSKLKAFINTYVLRILEVGAEKYGEDLLRFYTKEWQEYRFSAKVVDGIFSYLNRHWIKREMDEGNEEIYAIYTLCLVLWKEALFSRLRDRVTDAALDLIKKERCGEHIERGLISGVVDSFVELGIDDDEQTSSNQAVQPAAARNEEQKDPKRLEVYREKFETKFLAATEQFYEIEAQNFMAENPLTQYMKKVETRLREENDRCTWYLHRSTEPKLAKRVEKVLIQSRLEAFQAEFGTLLENRMDEDLARMYKLCERVEEGLANLRSALEMHITKEGLTAVEKITDSNPGVFQDAKLYVTTLLSVHKRYQFLVESAFKSEIGFLQSLDKAATTFVNKNSITQKNGTPNINKSPELLSKFCDQLLRKSNKLMDDSELEDTLQQVMVIFKYIEDKDIFSKFYTKMFSKRLITETSASEEAEMSFISKLKQSCGFEYTNRMSKMISDVQISKELTTGFRDQNDKGKLVDFNMLVLSTGSWPNMPVSSFHLPDKLGQCIDHFNKFYDEKHNGRKLTWVLSQCRGELSSTAFNGKKIFTVTTSQIAILMLFNEGLKYSAKQFVDTLAMDKKTVTATVNSLIKTDVLKGKDLDGKGEYEDDEEFTLNTKYSNKKVRVDLSKLVMRSDPKQDNQEVSKNVDEDRKSVISACIVRIMKMRKTLNHQQLMMEVLQQLSARFKPKVDLVKRCIGTLMEKEYIKRSEEQRDVYEYIA